MGIVSYSLVHLTDKMLHIADMLVRLEPPETIVTKDDLDYLREMYRIVVHQKQIPTKRDQGRIMMNWLALYMYAGTQVKERIAEQIGLGLNSGKFECPYCGGSAWFKSTRPQRTFKLNSESGCDNGCFRTKF